VLGGVFTGKRIGDREAVLLELSESDRDTGVNFLPVVRSTLRVLRIDVGDRVVAFVASDGRRVAEDDRNRDVALESTQQSDLVQC
jgi:hypothetical protein